MVLMTERLWLCEHTAYGPACSRLGAVEQARLLMTAEGGYPALLKRQLAAARPRRRSPAPRRRDDYVQESLL